MPKQDTFISPKLRRELTEYVLSIYPDIDNRGAVNTISLDGNVVYIKYIVNEGIYIHLTEVQLLEFYKIMFGTTFIHVAGSNYISHAKQ